MTHHRSPLPADLTPEQREVYDAIASGPRATNPLVPLLDEEGRLLGPFGLMLISSAMGNAVQGVGEAIRFHTDIAPLVLETAILTVAAHYRSDFEWFAHRTAALAAGVSEADLESVRKREQPRESAEAARVHTLVTQILVPAPLSAEDRAAAIDAFGERGLADLVWLVGYYSMLALALHTFEPALPAEATGWFADLSD